MTAVWSNGIVLNQNDMEACLRLRLCVGLWGWFGLFGNLLDVCGGFPLKRILADLAPVWSNGIVLHQNDMEACLRLCVGVVWGVLGPFGCVWGFIAKADFSG